MRGFGHSNYLQISWITPKITQLLCDPQHFSNNYIFESLTHDSPLISKNLTHESGTVLICWAHESESKLFDTWFRTDIDEFDTWSANLTQWFQKYPTCGGLTTDALKPRYIRGRAKICFQSKCVRRFRSCNVRRTRIQIPIMRIRLYRVQIGRNCCSKSQFPQKCACSRQDISVTGITLD